ncbi:unnamed protein product [Zymoseptoria tritici ST99CH_3D1]|nr:unnamed protein product [Zymoseptoria tritici ST99CH_3D1]
MDLLRLEQQRQALEQTLQNLRKSLKVWQTWEAEYEGFKEEIQEAKPEELDLISISKSYSGELVNEKEIRDLAGLNTDSPRTCPQIVGMVSRRQEYVQKNIETVQRQFFNAEAKLEELDFAAYSAANRDSAKSGLPLTEIHEELDEDGNVVSSSLSQPEAATTKLVDALRKAGLSDSELNHLSSAVESEPEDDEDNDKATKTGATNLPSAIVNATSREMPNGEAKHAYVDEAGSDGPSIRKKSVSFTADTKPAPALIRQESEDGRKSVSFAEKVAVMPSAPPPDSRSVSFSPQIEEIPAEPAKTVAPDDDLKADMQKALRQYFKPGEKVALLDEEGKLESTEIVIPENESEEDARLRREMLDYHLNEVGHVVAEMELEPDDYELDEEDMVSTSDHASSEYQDEDTPYTSGHSDSDDEDEDEFGRTKKRVIDDDYHKQMKELESRLIGNLGPAPAPEDVNALDPEINPEDIRRLVIREKRNSTSDLSSDSEKKSSGSKKRVSFADDLDVAQPESPALKAQKTQAGAENAAPIVGAVAERSTTRQPTLPSAPTPAKTSRFKKAREVETDYEELPTGPAGMIMAEKLMERPTPSRRVAAPSEDEPDEVMQRRELAAEYYRRRNDIVRQQGGFKGTPDEDDAEGELMEERDGKMKKVSRFRAARIKS